MPLREALAGVTSLAFDTSPFIYYIERHPAHVAVMRSIVQLVDSGTIRAYTSVITLTEVLTRPKQVGDARLEREYASLLLHSRNLTMVDIDSATAERAASLRADYRLRTPDALQVAAAIQYGCEAFLTNDTGLLRVTEVRVLLLDELTVQQSDQS